MRVVIAARCMELGYIGFPMRKHVRCILQSAWRTKLAYGSWPIVRYLQYLLRYYPDYTFPTDMSSYSWFPPFVHLSSFFPRPTTVLQPASGPHVPNRRAREFFQTSIGYRPAAAGPFLLLDLSEYRRTGGPRAETISQKN